MAGVASTGRYPLSIYTHCYLLQYINVHYTSIDKHCTALVYTTKHYNYTILPCTELIGTAIRCTYTALHCFALRLHYTKLYCTALLLFRTTLRWNALNYEHTALILHCTVLMLNCINMYAALLQTHPISRLLERADSYGKGSSNIFFLSWIFVFNLLFSCENASISLKLICNQNTEDLSMSYVLNMEVIYIQL